MNMIIKEAIHEKEFVDNLIMTIKSNLTKSPKGSLICDPRKYHVSYYQRYASSDGKIKRKYLKKNEISTVKDLAYKEYANSCLKKLESESKILDTLITKYDPISKYQIYGSLSPARQQLITPIKSPEEIAWEEWQNDLYEPYNAYPERLLFETDRNEYVRSKSEVLIANMLNKLSDYLDYKYEKILWLTGSGIAVHPDFTIFVKKTGQIIFLEHAGMMDDPAYAQAFVKKINSYIMNNIIPGKNLIISFETTVSPLNIGYLRKVILETLGIEN